MATLYTKRIEFEQALLNLLDFYEINVDVGTGPGTITSTTRLALINLVKAKLDEVIPEGEGLQFSLEDEKNVSDPLDLLINAILNEAGKRVLMNCPKHYLVSVKCANSAIPNSIDKKIGIIPLPDNFLRFISLKMAEWEREVAEPIPDNSLKILSQYNKITRGGTYKPQAILGKRYLINTKGGIVAVTLSSSNGGGTGYTPGPVILTVVQDGAANGTLNATANSLGQITSINSIATPGTNYSVATELSVTANAGTGCKINITEITEGYTFTKIIEYFSVKVSHAIDWLLYVPEQPAEDIQRNVWDAISWMAAGMVLQITERGDLAKLAFEQEALCYKNL